MTLLLPDRSLIKLTPSSLSIFSSCASLSVANISLLPSCTTSDCKQNSNFRATEKKRKNTTSAICLKMSHNQRINQANILSDWPGGLCCSSKFCKYCSLCGTRFLIWHCIYSVRPSVTVCRKSCDRMQDSVLSSLQKQKTATHKSVIGYTH